MGNRSWIIFEILRGKKEGGLKTRNRRSERNPSNATNDKENNDKSIVLAKVVIVVLIVVVVVVVVVAAVVVVVVECQQYKCTGVKYEKSMTSAELAP